MADQLPSQPQQQQYGVVSFCSLCGQNIVRTTFTILQACRHAFHNDCIQREWEKYEAAGQRRMPCHVCNFETEPSKMVREVKILLPPHSDKLPLTPEEELRKQVKELESRKAELVSKREDGQGVLQDKYTNLSELSIDRDAFLNAVVPVPATYDLMEKEAVELEQAVTDLTKEKEQLEFWICNILCIAIFLMISCFWNKL